MPNPPQKPTWTKEQIEHGRRVTNRISQAVALLKAKRLAARSQAERAITGRPPKTEN